MSAYETEGFYIMTMEHYNVLIRIILLKFLETLNSRNRGQKEEGEVAHPTKPNTATQCIMNKRVSKNYHKADC